MSQLKLALRYRPNNSSLKVKFLNLLQSLKVDQGVRPLRHDYLDTFLACRGL